MEYVRMHPDNSTAAEAHFRVGLVQREKSMSFVTMQPEMMLAAAGNLQGIGAGIDVQNAAAAGPTTAVVPAAADEVSVLTAAHHGRQTHRSQRRCRLP
jgi:hypothetical protein